MKKNYYGFTVIEIMIAVLILAILVTVAVPNYINYIKKSRRTDAINTLLAMQIAEEKYRVTNSSYGTLAQVWGGVTTSNGGYYTISISNIGASTYTLTATAGSSQSGDAEGATSCTSLTLTYSNGTSTKAPSTCWLND